jgi:hypothetical protein
LETKPMAWIVPVVAGLLEICWAIAGILGLELVT